MDTKYKGCKCPDSFFEETVITEDKEYNNGRPSIIHHCMNCGIDWAVFDKEFGFLISKYMKTNKEMRRVAKKYIVENIFEMRISSDIVAPDEETALRVFNSNIPANRFQTDNSRNHSCVEIDPEIKPKPKTKPKPKKVIKKNVKRKR